MTPSKTRLLCFVLAISILFTCAMVNAEDSQPFPGEDLNSQLVVSCHRLEIDRVVSLLRTGARVNSRFSNGDPANLRDPWFGSTPQFFASWTPLIALCASDSTPPPPVTFNRNDIGYADIAKMRAEARKLFSEELSMRRVSILRILLSHNCDVDMTSNGGESPLYHATSNRYLGICKILLKYKPNINLKTSVGIDLPVGRTALHAAAWSPKLRQIFIKHGGDDSILDGAGATPLELRQEYERKRLNGSRSNESGIFDE